MVWCIGGGVLGPQNTNLPMEGFSLNFWQQAFDRYLLLLLLLACVFHVFDFPLLFSVVSQCTMVHCGASLPSLTPLAQLPRPTPAISLTFGRGIGVVTRPPCVAVPKSTAVQGPLPSIFREPLQIKAAIPGAPLA